MTVGIYCRISQEKEKNDLSIEDQKMLGVEYCEAEGLEYKMYIDEGLSGTIDARPAFQELLSDIIEGTIQLVWVLDDARIQRDPQIRYLFNNTLREYNVEYYTHQLGKVDLFNPEMELLGGVMSEFNKYFVTITKLKIQSVLRRKVKGGKGWGIPPYGFTYDDSGFYKLHDEEKKIVKLIYEKSLSGLGTEKIAQYLNENNIPTRYNKYNGVIRLNRTKVGKKTKILEKKNIKWAGNTVRGIIKNTMFYGIKKIGNQTIDIKDPLFTIEYWEEVNHNLKHKNRNTKKGGGTKKYEYLLNHLIMCGRCKRNYNGKTRENKKDHFYYCMSKRQKGLNCGNRSINIDKIETLIWFLIFDSSTRDLLIEELGKKDKKEIYEKELSETREKIIELKKEKSNLLNIIAKGTISFEFIEEKIIEIRDKIEKENMAEEQISRKLRSIPLIEASEIKRDSDYFENIKFKEKQQLVEKIISSIEIFWQEEKIDGVSVRYYIVVVKFRNFDRKWIFVNDFSLNMNCWFKVDYNKSINSLYFEWRLEWHLDKNGKLENGAADVAFDFLKCGDWLPNYTTLVPYGDTNSWTQDDLEDYYGKVKYHKNLAELNHKLNNNLLKQLLY